MTDGHCFISYSNADGLEFATKLSIELESGQPFIKVWFDKNEMSSSAGDWDEQISAAISNSKCLLFVMSEDSTGKGSNCKEEWTWALKCKKPVICLVIGDKIEEQYRLNNRQKIYFNTNYDAGVAQLKKAIERLDSADGELDELNHRLAEAKRDLHRATDADKPRIKAELDELTDQIKRQEEIVRNPKAAEKRTEDNIQAGLERERQPEKPVSAKTSTKFINPPPGIAPNYFQDRTIETKQIVDFLNNDSQRLITVVGRAGVGKTAMVCRLLKALERGELPDDLGEMKVDGIVYLSETGSHRVNFANVFADLSKLLPKEIAETLEGIYKNPQTSTGDKMRALLDAFPSGRVILLLDNFETLIDPESLSLRDSELSDALNDLLGGQHHAVKAVITTRIAPRDLAVSEPGRQHHLSLDEGLESPYAENVLREMDADGRVGLKSAPDALLNKAREKTRGYPRALEALYAILSVDRYTTLEELLEISLPDEVVQKLVGEAFNRLDPSAQKVMQALAVYNRPVSPAAIDYLLQPHLPSIDSALVLNRLVNMHFARREAGRYYLHPADKEYAFGLIPNSSATKKESNEIIRTVKKKIQRNLSVIENSLWKMQQKPKRSFFDKLFLLNNNLEIAIEKLTLRLWFFKYAEFNTFTLDHLQQRSADYFSKIRTPRTEWKKLNDLVAQLVEFDLRCVAGDYDTAADVLTDIDFDYLREWGHFRLIIDMHEKLQEKITDKFLKGSSINNLAFAYNDIGQTEKAIYYFEKAFQIAKENKYRGGEAATLNNLGRAYADLGDTRKAIEYYEQALVINRQMRDRKGEAIFLENIGYSNLELNEYKKAEENIQKAIQIADDISLRSIQIFGRWRLAKSYLLQNDLVNARATIEAALQYNVPQYNHDATALHGIIALRQGERETAQEAFTKSITQADEILAKTPDYYSALDAKGLALCGLALCARDDGPSSMVYRQQAVETFRKARKIAPHAGVVKSNLRLFDELVKCEGGEILKDVRNAVEGV